MRGIGLLSVVFLIGQASCLPNPQVDEADTVGDLPTADFGEKDPREDTEGQYADPDAALAAELLAGLDSDAISGGCPYKVRVNRYKGTGNTGAYKVQKDYYGDYVMQNGLINGRNWYLGTGSRSDRVIRFSDKGNWGVGKKSQLYTSTSALYSSDAADCPNEIGYTWKVWVSALGTWVDAGKSMAIWKY